MNQRLTRIIDERLHRFLLIALIFLGITSLAGGAVLILDPSGAIIGITTGLLDGSPFGTYLVPGLVLFFLLGVGTLVVAYAFYRHQEWSLLATPLVGFVLTSWIVIQISIIGYHPTPPLQLTYGLIGLTLIAVGAVHLKRQSPEIVSATG